MPRFYGDIIGKNITLCLEILRTIQDLSIVTIGFFLIQVFELMWDMSYTAQVLP